MVCDSGGVIVAEGEVPSGRPMAGRGKADGIASRQRNGFGIIESSSGGPKVLPRNPYTKIQRQECTGAETDENLLPKGSLMRFIEPAARRRGSN